MTRNREHMHKLTELRDRLMGEIGRHQQAIEALKHQLSGVDQSMKALGGDAGAGPSRRTNVKRTVMEVIHDASRVGVTAVEVVDRAAAKGRSLDRASVSSLLSRLKRDGTLTFNGERYFEVPPSTPETPLKIVKSGNGG
jgi:CRP-like cAMP-binding protein